MHANSMRIPSSDYWLVYFYTYSMLSQYAMTFAGVSGGTGYAVWKKPPKGMHIMILAGVAGSVLDLAYGWTSACKDEVDEWRRQPGS